MPEEKAKKKKKIHERVRDNSSGGAIYGLGLIGAAVYYLINANNFWDVILGLLKSVLWPAFLIFRLFEFLGM